MNNESNNVFYFLDTLDLKGKKFVEINERAIPNIMPKKFYVSFDGEIYNTTTHKFSRGHVNKRGYVTVELTDYNNHRISTSMHNVIEKVFDWFPGCENLEVNHKNGIHNDNRFNNLELVTHTENVHHAYATGLNKYYGENHLDATTTDKQVKQICELLQIKNPRLTYAEIGERVGVSEIVVVQVATGICWVRSTEKYGYTPTKRNKRFTDEEVHKMCEIFVRLKGHSFDEIVTTVAKELGYELNSNFVHKLTFIYYRRKSYFTRITDLYDY